MRMPPATKRRASEAAIGVKFECGGSRRRWWNSAGAGAGGAPGFFRPRHTEIDEECRHRVPAARIGAEAEDRSFVGLAPVGVDKAFNFRRRAGKLDEGAGVFRLAKLSLLFLAL